MTTVAQPGSPPLTRDRTSRRIPGRSFRQQWLDLPVRRKGFLVIALPVSALVVVVAMSLVLLIQERQARAESTSARNFSSAAQNTLNLAVDAETGVRGYAASKLVSLLQPYNSAVTGLPGALTALAKAGGVEGPAARADATALEASARSAFASLRGIRDSVAAGATTSVIAGQLQASKAVMDGVRAQVAAINQREGVVVTRARSEIDTLETAGEAIDIAGLVVGAAGGLIGISLFGTGIARRLRAAVANAGRLGRGEPVQVTTNAQDELGQLSVATLRAADLLQSRSAELAAARDTAMEASQAKTEFLSRVSHELRTPLNAMLGFTQLLELDESDPDRRHDISRILRAGGHLLAMINDVLDIARIESREMALSLEPVTLADVVAEATDMLEPLAASRRIAIELTGADPDLTAVADSQRLKQVLLNLLSNAVKYNRDAGRVTLAYEAAGDNWVEVAVSDTGPGLSDAQLERIFLPFERVGKVDIEGTGIGLTLTKGLVETMDGKLTVRSEPGVGSTFTVRLPRAGRPLLVDDGLAGAAPVPNLSISEPETRLLYIEDNVANIHVIEQLLRNRPKTVLYAAGTGQLGLDLARHHHPTQILLDLHLPDMSGDHVLTRLRAEPTTAATPITILSADATVGTIRRLLAKGANGYLTKPLNLREILALLDRPVQ